MEDSFHGRVDFAQLNMDPAVIRSSRTLLTYRTKDAVTMKLWANGSSASRDLQLSPTLQDRTIELGDAFDNSQVSLTVAGEHKNLELFSLDYRFNLECGEDCGNRAPSVGNCPQAPLPGVIADPNPVAPIARATYTANEPAYAPLAVQFSGRRSFDANLEELSYHWDFGDGEEAIGREVTHTYQAANIYYARLTVTDPSGKSDQELLAIKVTADDPSNNSPTAKITADRELILRPYTLVNLSASSSTDIDDDPLEYVWYIKDRQEVIRGRDIQVDLNDSPSLTINLDISDGRGRFDTDFVTLSARDMPEHNCEIHYYDNYPFFHMLVDVFNTGPTPITDWRFGWMFNSPVSLEENFFLLNRFWTPVAGSNPYFFSGLSGGKDLPAYSWTTFSVEGESDHPIQDILVESVSGLDCRETKPQQKNHAPVPKITITYGNDFYPREVTFDAGDSFDPDGDVITLYRWEFSDGFSAEGERITRAYNGPISSTVTLVISDGELEASGTDIPNITDEPGISCSTTFRPINETSNEYTAEIWLKNRGPDTASAVNGTISLSHPVSITAADDGTGIPLVQSTMDVVFDLDLTIEPGAEHTIEFSGVMSDRYLVPSTQCEKQ